MTNYPEGPITPQAAYYHLKGRHPLVTLWAYDESNSFSILGGKAIPDNFTAPESVMIKKGGLKGLIAPWDIIDQKGASEDGVTFVDALQRPTEVEIKLLVRGRTPQRCRRLCRLIIASIDKKRTSELSFIDQDTGRWWADVRWMKNPPDVAKIGESCSAELTLVLRADNGFWRTFPVTDSFGFKYEDMADQFDYDTEEDGNLGPNWPLYYTEEGGGFIYADGKYARWKDDPDDWLITDTREVVCGPYKDFETATDNQVVSMVLGSFQEWSLPEGAANDLWARMGRNEDGSWNGNGIRMRIENNIVKLSYFKDFSQTVLAQRLILLPPIIGEKWVLIAGYEGDGNERVFKVLRFANDKGAGVSVLTVKESGAESMMGADHRGIGFGMQAGAAILTQATPASLHKVTAGDNSTVSQSGFIEIRNIGDQDMPLRYTLYGPGKFKFAAGPGQTEMIEFGPLLPNQVVFIDTSRQNPKIKDLTSVPPTQQELSFFQKALKDILSWATGNNTNLLVQQIGSVFGIIPPQGNLYSLLKGKWNKNSVIPAKSPGEPDSQVKPYFVKVAIDDGNADSKIVAAGTPLRRYPL
ncbi:minor tail protein [Mycobacterium phage MooMoo]|uniref:Minor tail protein n=1 Tax=Mycobacterium phage MooMoo TaxID=2108127 RepID=A0A2P1JR67_9CAUD|nr:minor tail protein [Mycobacterium phage MooMoo]AVO21621.1 minor tail protein [Mycobacterium phage MooMoo]